MNYGTNPLIPGGNARQSQAAVKSNNPLIPGNAAGIKRLSAGLAVCSKATSGSTPKLAAPDALQLAKINQLAKREHSADEIIVGQMRLAHNAIDRDNERFSEEVLQGFLATIVRKTLLFDHDRNVSRAAIGKFFDAVIEKMNVSQANMETGETLLMPDGNYEVQFLCPWFYIPRKALTEQDAARLDAGIFDFASIGFSAEKRIPIFDSTGKTLYHEYQGKAEALEGSLVWLGAQHGASLKTPGSKGAEVHCQAPDESFNPLIPK